MYKGSSPRQRGMTLLKLACSVLQAMQDFSSCEVPVVGEKIKGWRKTTGLTSQQATLTLKELGEAMQTEP